MNPKNAMTLIVSVVNVRRKTTFKSITNGGLQGKPMEDTRMKSKLIQQEVGRR